MNIADVIEKIEQRAARTPFDSEREICRRKIMKLREKVGDDQNKKAAEDNIQESRDTFAKAFYPWFTESVDEGFAPFCFYPYMKDVVFEKCSRAMGDFPGNKRIAKMYKQLIDCVSEYYQDYYYYRNNAGIDYGTDYFIMFPEELVFFLSTSYDKEKCIKEAFDEFEKKKENFFERLNEGAYDDIIAELNKKPLLEQY